MSLSTDHLALLTHAKHLLGPPGLAAKIAGLLGIPVDRGYERLPPGWHAAIDDCGHESLRLALRGGLATLGSATIDAFPRLDRFATLAGGPGNEMPALSGIAIEMPVSIMLLCRSLADIARGHGEGVERTDVRLACLEAFAHGSGDDRDYYVVRDQLAQTAATAAEYLADALLVDESAPALVAYVDAIAVRFRAQLADKAAAQALRAASAHDPAKGAGIAGAIDLLFADHFQDVARGHFAVRKLERVYSRDEVRSTYARIAVR
jgi:EcsC protein family